jgi:hypothetical protein
MFSLKNDSTDVVLGQKNEKNSEKNCLKHYDYTFTLRRSEIMPAEFTCAGTSLVKRWSKLVKMELISAQSWSK